MGLYSKIEVTNQSPKVKEFTYQEMASRPGVYKELLWSGQIPTRSLHWISRGCGQPVCVSLEDHKIWGYTGDDLRGSKFVLVPDKIKIEFYNVPDPT